MFYACAHSANMLALRYFLVQYLIFLGILALPQLTEDSKIQTHRLAKRNISVERCNSPSHQELIKFGLEEVINMLWVAERRLDKLEIHFDVKTSRTHDFSELLEEHPNNKGYFAAVASSLGIWRRLVDRDPPMYEENSNEEHQDMRTRVRQYFMSAVVVWGSLVDQPVHGVDGYEHADRGDGRRFNPETDPNLQIWCDDTWLQPVGDNAEAAHGFPKRQSDVELSSPDYNMEMEGDSEGEAEEEEKDDDEELRLPGHSEHSSIFHYIDNRPGLPQQEGGQPRVLAVPMGTYTTQGDETAGSPARPATLVFNNMAGPYSSVISFDPKMLDRWAAERNMWNLLSSKPEMTIGEDGRARVDPSPRWNLKLESVVANQFAPNLLHAIMRLENFGNSPDDYCNQQHKYGSKIGYEWECLTKLSNTPWKAYRSAKTFVYVVTALYLRYQDWTMGYSQFYFNAVRKPTIDQIEWKMDD